MLESAPNMIVFFLPTLSDRMPVGTSKIASEILVIEKILIPSAREPVTFVKYNIAIAEYSLKSVKKLNQANSLMFFCDPI